MIVGEVIGSYEIERMIGKGGCSSVYSVKDVNTEEEYAMKVEYKDDKRKLLANEIKVMENLSDCKMFPRLVCSGEEPTFRWMVIEHLGESLASCHQKFKNRNGYMTFISRIALYMLRCIQQLHASGYVHRDIKPGNFLIRNDSEFPICLIDFGLAKRFINGDRHISFKEKVGFLGTSRYASVNAHQQVTLSRRDDLMSWFYSVVELASGLLPWADNTVEWRTKEMKKNISSSVLCRKLPNEFIQIYKYISGLGFDETPNYMKIIRLIRSSLKETHSISASIFSDFFGEQKFVKLEEGQDVNSEGNMTRSLDLSYDKGGCSRCNVC